MLRFNHRGSGMLGALAIVRAIEFRKSMRTSVGDVDRKNLA